MPWCRAAVKGARFDIALFTNLTRDHLDFHGDLETYFAAKRRLFDALKPGGKGVANLDDAYGRRLASELGLAHTFGSSGSGAAVRPGRRRPRRRGDPRRARHAARAGAVPVAAPRALQPLEPARGRGRGRSAGPAGRSVSPPGSTRPGRSPGAWTRCVPARHSWRSSTIAHTDAALEAAIRSLRELTGNKVVVVFGCGGDRDPGKRPLMGKVAGDLADLPIATSDNPRSEDPLAILAAVEEGLKASTNRNYRIVPDRREAIRRAVTVAMGGGWSVLVAGKGHENEQIVGNQRLPFSDRDELERAIVEHRGSEVRG